MLYDSTASTFLSAHSVPQPVSSIPLVRDFIPFGLLKQPRIYQISGNPQSYKTTIGVEMASDFLSLQSSRCEIAWVDCDQKFPIDLMRARKVDLSRILYSSCQSSEELLMSLLSLENKIKYHEKDGDDLLRAIFIDGFNSSFWIDEKAKEYTKPIRWTLKSIIEKFVTAYGVSVVAVFQDLGDFDIWESFDTAPSMKLRCKKLAPGKGALSYKTFSDEFEISRNREIVWGKRKLNNEEVEQNEREDE